MAENEAPGPERDSSLENEEIEKDGTFACENFTISIQEVDDSTISTTEVDPYYEEEIVDTSPADEDECQRQPQSPQIHNMLHRSLFTSSSLVYMAVVPRAIENP
ncbi:hypothetical protein FPOAC1_007281 [Fusarium poae]|uniref:hypothetical protein n=1 Tax=Fusarium poae TaxID=36050 RepID=UPI001CE7B99F|nr:hypothetical protein FPOAC1_007281 [Fusarium poae]KAG8673962.1 hypothetical protein FPOAC1_007281 [Fusarium poae]